MHTHTHTHQLNNAVSGALDRLHYEKDPCVRYDSTRKVWIYLHRGRSEEDFGRPLISLSVRHNLISCWFDSILVCYSVVILLLFPFNHRDNSLGLWGCSKAEEDANGSITNQTSKPNYLGILYRCIFPWWGCVCIHSIETSRIATYTCSTVIWMTWLFLSFLFCNACQLLDVSS